MFETVTGKYGSAFDYELWLRIANRYPVAVIDRRLMNYRSHSKSGTAGLRRRLTLPGILPVLQEYKDFARDERTRMLCERCIDANYLQFGRRQNYAGEYGFSDETMRNVRLLRHMPQKFLIIYLQTLSISDLETEKAAAEFCQANLPTHNLISLINRLELSAIIEAKVFSDIVGDLERRI